MKNYRKAIHEKALEVMAAGALGGGNRFLFTPERMKHMRAVYLGNGEFDLINNGFQFGRMVLDFNSIKLLENHYEQHIDKLPDPRKDIFRYILSGDIVLKNMDFQDYNIMFDNYKYMTDPRRTVEELQRRSFENAHLGKAIFTLKNGGGELLQRPVYIKASKKKNKNK